VLDTNVLVSALILGAGLRQSWISGNQGLSSRFLEDTFDEFGGSSAIPGSN
jgi:predicted nucleic acid-binding protein